MGKIRSYQDLIAWQKAYTLAKAVFATTKNFPEEEELTFVDPMRKASIRVASKIADGWGRRSRQDYARAVNEARGYMYDVQTQLMLARDLGYVQDDDPAFEAIEEAERLINGLIRALERKDSERRPDRRPRAPREPRSGTSSSESSTEQPAETDVAAEEPAADEPQQPAQDESTDDTPPQPTQ